MPKNTPSGKVAKGIYRHSPPTVGTPDDKEQRVAEFSYQNDALADLIVKAWTDKPFYDELTKQTNTEAQRSDAAKDALDDRGVHMMKPIVITEAEYYQGYTMADDAGVVFVLPDAARANIASGGSLLEVAKLLMACTPNGI
jgi:hypothetical protein